MKIIVNFSCLLIVCSMVLLVVCGGGVSNDIDLG